MVVPVVLPVCSDPVKQAFDRCVSFPSRNNILPLFRVSIVPIGN